MSSDSLQISSILQLPQFQLCQSLIDLFLCISKCCTEYMGLVSVWPCIFREFTLHFGASSCAFHSRLRNHTPKTGRDRHVPGEVTCLSLHHTLGRCSRRLSRAAPGEAPSEVPPSSCSTATSGQQQNPLPPLLLSPEDVCPLGQPHSSRHTTVARGAFQSLGQRRKTASDDRNMGKRRFPLTLEREGAAESKRLLTKIYSSETSWHKPFLC